MRWKSALSSINAIRRAPKKRMPPVWGKSPIWNNLFVNFENNRRLLFFWKNIYWRETWITRYTRKAHILPCAEWLTSANWKNSINKKLRQICGQVGGPNTFLLWISFFAFSTTGLLLLVAYRRCKSFGFRFGGSGGHGTDAGATEVTILVDSREEPLLKALKVFEG